MVAGANGGNTSPLISNINQPNENHTYTYDDAGNILSVKRGSITTTYAYDGIGQLMRVNDPNDTAGGSSGTTWVYEYDRGGNMTAKKRYAYTTGTLGTVQQMVSYTYGDSNWKDKLTAYNGQTFTYDTISNVKTAEGWTYAWMRGRYLMTITKGTAGTAGYEQHKFDYDHKGRCIGRTYVYYDTSRSKNVWRGYSYTWAGERLVHLVTSNRVGDTGNYTTDETMHFHYDAQGKPSMMMYNGTRFGYLYNAQGDVIGIITGGLTEKVKYTYDAWGRLLSISGSSANTLGKANPFRYRAYIYDQECGLYYLRTRYYNPNWCRFINADSIISMRVLGCNAFSYCNNNAIRQNDPSGKDKYLRNEACAYARKWAKGGIGLHSPNQMFYYYDGGDCSNFTSQCVNAGGIPMDPQWHSYKKEMKVYRYIISGIGAFGLYKEAYNWDVSLAWRSANDQYEYFRNSKYVNNVIVFSSKEGIPLNIQEVQKADLLYFDFESDGIIDHSSIVTGIDDTDIRLTYHSVHEQDASLKNKMQQYSQSTIYIMLMADEF